MLTVGEQSEKNSGSQDFTAHCAFGDPFVLVLSLTCAGHPLCVSRGDRARQVKNRAVVGDVP